VDAIHVAQGLPHGGHVNPRPRGDVPDFGQVFFLEQSYLIQQLTDGLTAAAERETDPERKSGLRQAAALLGGAVRGIAVDVAARAVERSMGLG